MIFFRTGDLTEVPVPTRFIFILLGPQGNQGRYHEIGRSIATLMSDEVNTSCSPLFLVVEGVNNKLETRAVFVNEPVRTPLHQVSVPIQCQRCDDASDTSLIKMNEVAPKCVATLFWSDSIDLSKEASLTSSQRLGCIGTDTWCENSALL